MIMMVVSLQNGYFLSLALQEVSRQGYDARPGVDDEPVSGGEAWRLNPEAASVPAVLDLGCM